MADERIKVILDVQAEVNKVENSLRSLRENISNIQLPKGLGKEFEDRISKLSSEIKNFHSLSSKMGDSFDTSGKIDSSYKKILEYARKLKITIGTIRGEVGIDADKFFPVDIINRIEKAEKAIEDYNSAIEKGSSSYKKQIDDLRTVEKQLDSLRKKQITLEATKSTKKTEFSEAKKKQAETTQKSDSIKQASSQEQIEIQKRISLLKEEREAVKAVQKAKEESSKAKIALEGVKGYDKGNATQQKSYDSKKRNYDAAAANLQRAEEAARKYGEALRSIPDIDAEIEAQNQALVHQKEVYSQAESEIKKVNAEVGKAASAYNKSNQDLENNSRQIQQYVQEQEKLNNAIRSGQDAVKNNAMSVLVASLKEIDIIIDPTKQSLEEVKTIINNLRPEAIQQLEQNLRQADLTVDQLDAGLEALGNKNRVFQEGATQVRQMTSQIDTLKTRIQYFFGLTNSVMLFRGGLQQAIETIKQLDAAMTETAVVTDFSVGDMWEQLPRYTDAANALGTTTLGAYETMTLFYQQGLETNQVFEIGTETMKMARIAGLEYKDATDLMTAALRGFNMELNETSATRVNDVYSKLAAITAADTGEIATAMTKTASIASNANMEFETTAAFLSQIIETTREPAETAGTAMKTIIARFTEMKKASSEIINIDGEEVNVNKVEAALKTAGVALRDVNGEFRDLDDVFLELSSKWNGLDKMTQRYIATMAAGSRQQSRFIAMMQDYDRTMELVDAAYDSSGASQKQFEKTQESLESKINKLKNAWNEYLMGISNSSVIKTVIDLLTGLLNIVNKVTGAFGEGVGGILKFGTAIGTLKAASKLSNKALSGVANYVTSVKQMNSVRQTGTLLTGAVATEEQKQQAMAGNRRFFATANTPIKKASRWQKAGAIASGERQAKQTVIDTINYRQDRKRQVPLELDKAKQRLANQERAYSNLSLRGLKPEHEANWQKQIEKTKAEIALLKKELAELEKPIELNVLTKQARAEVEALKAQVEANQFDVNLQLQLAEAEAKLEVFEQAEQADDIDKKVTVDTTVADLELEAAQQRWESDPVVETVVTSGRTGFKDAKTQNWFKGEGSSFKTGLKDANNQTKAFFSSFKKDSDGASKAASAFGAKVSAAGGKAAKGLGSVLGVLSGIPAAVWIAAGALVAVGATIYTAWYTSAKQTSKRMAEDAEKNTKRLEESAKSLETTINEVTDAYEKLSNSNLDSLVEGTLEWKKALLESNQAILELIEKYPELKDALEYGENGRLELNQQKYEKYINSQLSKQDALQTGQQFKQVTKTYRDAMKDLEDEYTYEEIGVQSKYPGGIAPEDKTYDFSTAYEKAKTGNSFIDESRFPKRVERYNEYSNERAKIENDYLQGIASMIPSYLPKNVSAATKKSAEKIVDSMLTDQTLYDLEGKTFQGKEIKQKRSGSYYVDGATGEDIRDLTDEQLASAGFEWTDENKTSLRKIGDTTDTTFKVAKYGAIDNEDDLEGQTGSNNYINAGWLMSQVASNQIQDITLRNASLLAQSLPDTVNELMAGGFATDEEISATSIQLDNFYKENQKKIKEIDEKINNKETTEEEKAKLEEEKKYLEDTQKYLNDNFADNEFIGPLLPGQLTKGKLKNIQEQNLTDLNNKLTSFGLKEINSINDTEQLNNYKKIFDHIEELNAATQIQIMSSFDNTTDKIEDQELVDFTASLNTESAILGMSQLKKGLDSTNENIKTFSEEMIKASEESSNFYSAQNQVKELLMSDEYAEYAGELSELANQGKLTASSIYELANENELLGKTLDNESVKAGALAKIFEKVQKGELELSKVTQNLIEYYNELTASATSSAKALNFVKNFEASESQVTAAEGWKEWANSLKEYAAAGAYNDQYFTDLLKNFASEKQWEAWEKVGTTNQERYNQLKSTIGQQAQGTSYDVLYAGANSTEKGNAVYLQNGKLTFNLSDFKTMDALIEGIATQYRISEDYANQLIADTRIYNTELDSTLNKMDKQNAFLNDINDYGTINSNDYEVFLTQEQLEARGYKDADTYKKAFEKATGVKITVTTEFEPAGKVKQQVDAFIEKTRNEINSEDYVFKIAAKVQIEAEKYDLSAGDARKQFGQALAKAEIIARKEGQNFQSIGGFDLTAKAIQNAPKDMSLAAYKQKIVDAANALSDALTAAQDVANAEQQLHIAEQGQAVYDAYYGAISKALADAFNGFSVTYTYDDINGEPKSGTLTFEGSVTSSGSNPYKANVSDAKKKLADAKTNLNESNDAYDALVKQLGLEDTTASPYNPPGSGGNGGGGGGSSDTEKVDYYQENEQKKLDALDRLRETNDREADLISKLPSEIQGIFQLANIAEDMGYEYQEILINRNRLGAYQQDLDTLHAQGVEKGFIGQEGGAQPIYYDNMTGEYMYNLDVMDSYSEGQRQKAQEFMNSLDEINSKVKEVEKELDGGKVQAFVKALSKGTNVVSKVLKSQGKDTKEVNKELSKLEKQLGLTEGTLKPLVDKFGDMISKSKYLNSEFEGLGKTGDKLVDAFKGGPLGKLMSDETAKQLKEGGVTKGQLGGSILGDVGEALGFSGDLLNFDMMGMGLDFLNTGKSIFDQGKQMAEQVIGYITQATQVIVDAWTNREDYLYNFLKIIEKHLAEYEKLQRYSTQLEKGRLSSSQDILNNWNNQWKSLQLQLEEQQERLETRQKELNRSRWSPFSLISGWNPSSDTLYENREFKFMWDLFIGFGQMAPMGLGQFFAQLNQLYEDYDERVQKSYEDRLEAEQAILDIEDERLELVKVGSEEATEFEQKLLDAMIQKEQEQIDELTRLNDAITDANSKLISTLQDNLDKMRQDRENEKREEELGEKERRLAYLRQDTSGANMMEIKKLEEELEEGHEDYTDTLIDQKISELEKQNELAAEQRQQQIDLLQGQLDYAEKYGLYWDAIYGMLYTIDENGNAILNPENFDLDGNIRENSELAKMLGTFSDRLGMSVWSAVLDNEEVKRLGRYYGAFIGMNGVRGDWANYWALKDPGASDPNYAYPTQEIPKGFWGALYRIEIAIKKYFANSDPDIIDRFGRFNQAFKNFFGKLFGIEDWVNYQYEAVNAAHIQSTTAAGMKKSVDDFKEWVKSLFSKNESYGIKTSRNLIENGTQNIRDINTTNYFQIGTVGETISLDEMVDRVAERFKDMFSVGNNILGRSRA